MTRRALAGRPDGYWPKGTEESAKARAVAEFERLIYPIWKGIEERDRLAENKMTMAEINAIPVLLEVTTLHKQDNAIISSGIKPEGLLQTADAGHELRRKAAASERFARAQGGS